MTDPCYGPKFTVSHKPVGIPVFENSVLSTGKEIVSFRLETYTRYAVLMSYERSECRKRGEEEVREEGEEKIR